MVPGFEKVESLDSIVAQVNHRGLGVKVETNCLRNSDLIPLLKLGPNEKCVKGMQVRKQDGGEEVHHIPHTWENSCREAGFSRMHTLNLGQFSKTHAFFTRYWIP